MPAPVFRFAPSPNGFLHLGHAFSAIVGYEMASSLGGRFLVRIEDIDTGRSSETFIRSIFDDLHWLGIRWEEPVLRQSNHFTDYRQAADRLEASGLLYPCFATRSEIAAAVENSPHTETDPDGIVLYPALHRHLPATEVSRRKDRGEPFALRIDMERALLAVREKLGSLPLTFAEISGCDSNSQTENIHAHPERWGDAVIVRKDVPASYHLAVVADDARQGVSHVTRGKDLFAATDLQRLLQVLLDLPQPLYHHHRLITDAAGRKLSKSAQDTSLSSLRVAGVTPAAIRTQLGIA